MDKSIALRRKSQQLARDGQIQRAIDEMENVLRAGEADPYDFVFHGDLLVRARRIAEAVASFQEAISAYEKVGLYRNAIAIGKKILRTDPGRARTYQRLGDLYAKEGLMGEAITHFLIFLDRAGGEVTGDEFLETLERVAELSGPKVEVALRLADLYVRAGREDRAVRMLEEIAEQASASGAFDIALSLRERAGELSPLASQEGVEKMAGEEIRPAGTEPPEAPVDAPGHTITLSGDGRLGGADSASVPASVPDLSQAAFEHFPGVELRSAASQLDAWEERAPADDSRPAPPLMSAPAPLLEPSPTPEPETAPAGEPEPAMPVLAAIEEACAEERWVDARNLCESALEINPEDLEVLEKLVAVSRHLGDTLATVHALTLLGDLMIKLDDLERAQACFVEVLGYDPQNITAHRRLARFRELRVPGSERIPEEYRSSIQALAETKGATVAVRDQSASGGVESEEWIDLTTLLQEFREGIRTQVASADYLGHYDLALSHLDMGLYEEALEEFDQVLLAGEIPPEIELKTREMRGNCLQNLSRTREAIHEFRMALEVPKRPERERREVLYQLAVALESAGETEEARSILRSLATAEPPLGAAKILLDRLEAA